MKTYYIQLCFLLLLIGNFSYSQTDVNAPVHGITIYIDYADAPATVTPVQFDSLINGITYSEAGVERTFRSYWRQETRRYDGMCPA